MRKKTTKKGKLEYETELVFVKRQNKNIVVKTLMNQTFATSVKKDYMKRKCEFFTVATVLYTISVQNKQNLRVFEFNRGRNM